MREVSSALWQARRRYVQSVAGVRESAKMFARQVRGKDSERHVVRA